MLPAVLSLSTGLRLTLSFSNSPADYFLELVPGLPIKLNAIGDLLTALNGLTGDLLFK